MLMVTQWLPFLNTPRATRLWQISAAILAGACGNIILICFLSGLMGMGTMAHLRDWIVGFNAAMTGYMLVEKSGADLRFRCISASGAGLINTVLTLLAIDRLYTLSLEKPLFDIADAGILLAVGAICGALGGMLAKKYLELKNNSRL